MEEPLPETRFDRWPTDDVYTALETALGEVTHSLDHYRACDPVQKEALLERSEVRLRTALQAMQTLRKRVVNDKRF